MEFGLILPVLLLLVGGIIDFGIMFNKQILLTNAARDGARMVVTNASVATGWSQGYIDGRIRNAASPLTSGSLTVSSTAWDCSAGPGSQITVTVAAPYDYTVLKFVPGLPKPAIKGTATMTCA
ncbi:TadE/TadG family type IV pilus assembly protein [Knoellia koreensis]|uniref:TadE/TadG family type IV pilus assembly protein n=1 Tax=Knoellia koreensis TaxID=2730921 RepID=UPI0019817E26